MRKFVTPANAVTSGNLSAGFLALVAAHANRLLWAAVLVVIASILDSLDGLLARRSGSDGGFGGNLDSLSDLVSFGVAPAFALYLGPLQALPGLGLAACLVFVLCGGWRLARFQLIKDPSRFTGLPIPPTGVVVAVLAFWGPAPVALLVVTVVLSVLMVSSFPFPTIPALLGRATSLSRLVTHRRSPGG